jgi:hypothetical protein
VPPAARDQAQASGQRRFVHWPQAVARMRGDSGRPVPWPLADPEGNRCRAAGGAQGTASRSPEGDLPPPPRPGAF